MIVSNADRFEYITFFGPVVFQQRKASITSRSMQNGKGWPHLGHFVAGFA